MYRFKPILFLSLFLPLGILAQNATVSGVVFDENQNPLPNVNITAGKLGTTSDSNGAYLLQIIADKKTSITFSHIGHKEVILTDLILNTNESFEFNPVMSIQAVQMDEIQITPTGRKSVQGITTINPQVVRKIPGANAGVENLLETIR